MKGVVRDDAKLVSGNAGAHRMAAGRDNDPLGGDALAFDVSDADAVGAAAREVFSRHKRLDVLVNNAGVLEDALLGMIQPQRTYDVNALGVLNTMQACARLVDYLPPRLDGHRSRVISPVTPLTHAWGTPAIVMRCGVPRPSGYSPESAQTTDVDGVLWYQQVQGDIVRWTAIRHDTNVELLVPTSYDAQGGLLVELGHAIKQRIP